MSRYLYFSKKILFYFLATKLFIVSEEALNKRHLATIEEAVQKRVRTDSSATDREKETISHLFSWQKECSMDKMERTLRSLSLLSAFDKRVSEAFLVSGGIPHLLTTLSVGNDTCRGYLLKTLMNILRHGQFVKNISSEEIVSLSSLMVDFHDEDVLKMFSCLFMNNSECPLTTVTNALLPILAVIERESRYSTPTMSLKIMAAVIVLKNMASDSVNHMALVEAGAVPLFMNLFQKSPFEALRMKIVETLCAIMLHRTSHEVIAEKRVISFFLEVLVHGTRVEKPHMAGVLTILASEDLYRDHIACSYTALMHFVQMLESDEPADQNLAAEAIARISNGKTRCMQIESRDVIRNLISLLRKNNPASKWAALALGNISIITDIHVTIVKEDAIALVVNMLLHDDTNFFGCSGKLEATRSLACFSVKKEYCLAIVDAGGVPLLLDVYSKNACEEGKTNSAAAIAHMSQHVVCREAVRSCLPIFLSTLRDRFSIHAYHLSCVLKAISFLMNDPDCQTAFVTASGIELLVHLLRDEKTLGKKWIAKTLSVLSTNKNHCVTMMTSHGIPLLVSLLEDSSAEDELCTVWTILTLFHLSNTDAMCRVAICEAGGVRFLVALLRACSVPSFRMETLVKIVSRLVSEKVCLTAICNTDGIPLFVSLLRDTVFKGCWTHSLRIVLFLAGDKSCHEALLAEYGLFQVLIAHCSDTSAENTVEKNYQQQFAATALGKLACNEHSRAAIVYEGAMSPLIRMCRDALVSGKVIDASLYQTIMNISWRNSAYQASFENGSGYTVSQIITMLDESDMLLKEFATFMLLSLVNVGVKLDTIINATSLPSLVKLICDPTVRCNCHFYAALMLMHFSKNVRHHVAMVTANCIPPLITIAIGSDTCDLKTVAIETLFVLRRNKKNNKYFISAMGNQDSVQALFQQWGEKRDG